MREERVLGECKKRKTNLFEKRNRDNLFFNKRE